MSSSKNKRGLLAANIRCTSDTLTVELSDGRAISVPLEWFPRLLHGTKKERAHWRLIAKGYGVHWPSLDEDISVENLLEGHRSRESRTSLNKWLALRDSAKVKSSRKTKRRNGMPRTL
ncbi:MAG: DUF2442 domain-containing protein [Gemmataceae bacterium]|nr:DUF2442 domain-containing protein [Gemmataceae bacterium]